MQASGLVKRYGTVTAVSGVDLTVNRGTCVGIVGRNGAGKSTMMRMLTTVSRPTAGQLSVFGLAASQHAKSIKKRLGVVPQSNSLDEELTVQQNLEIYSRYFGMSRIDARRAAITALEFARLLDKAHDNVSTLSGGMKRRLAIARSLVNEPDLILMDEPTAALDAQSKHSIWSALGDLRADGRTIVLMSHDMEEIQSLSDHVLIMRDGAFIAEGQPDWLIAMHCHESRIDVVIDQPDAVDWRAVFRDPAIEVNRIARGVGIEVDNGERGMALLRASAVKFTAATVRPATLEDAFLRITGRTAD